MNPVDVAILVVLILFLIKGLVRGLLQELCALLGLAAGIVVAFRYHGPLAQWLSEVLRLSAAAGVATAFFLLLLITVLLFAVLGHLLSRYVNLLFLGGFNRVAGGLFGLAQGVVLLSVLLFAFDRHPFPKALQPVLAASQLAPPLVQLGESAYQESFRVLPMLKDDRGGARTKSER
jgi:membrane protein required for colicin V production